MARAVSQDVKIKVVVARRDSAARAEAKRPLIAVIPDYDDWNDYGFRLFAKILILPEEGGGEEAMLPLRLMFEGQEIRAGRYSL